ncbi:thaumatin-like protein, partial [Dinothrombium tinctorium]
RVPCRWKSARIWARTDCDGSGRNCETGDCGALKCQGAGQADVSLAELTLDGGGNNNFKNDVYDISAVDGFNLPISITPINGVKIGQQFGFSAKYDCVKTECKFDFRNNCLNELKKWVRGRVASCLSACTKFNNDQFCCRGAFNNPQTCPVKRDRLVRYFKDRCPDMYSYAYDDEASTFHCQGEKGTKYRVSFCPP